MKELNTAPINIAIDGPAGAGKSTVARQVASALRYVYVDTGAMYRAVTLKVLESHLTTEDTQGIVRLIKNLHISLKPGDDKQLVFVNGEDVTSRLRSLEVNRNVSYVARLACVRERMAQLQRQIAKQKGVVMDGRDIGTNILPNAELKIFLTATICERAERRFNEMGPEAGISIEQLVQEMTERDQLDRERKISPLSQASDAKRLDTTGMKIEQVVRQIVMWGRAASRTNLAEEK